MGTKKVSEWKPREFKISQESLRMEERKQSDTVKPSTDGKTMTRQTQRDGSHGRVDDL